MEGHSIAQRLGAEFIGTALLVFVGAGSVPAILVLESGTEAPFTASIGTSGPATCATRPAKPCAIASLWETRTSPTGTTSAPLPSTVPATVAEAG